LIHEIAGWLGDSECYCVPYSHLARFYGQVGFVEMEEDSAPEFLSHRLTEYRRSGLDVLLMRRPAYFLGARPSVSSM
jgi:hypothetical protein